MRYASKLRFPRLLAITAALFVIDLLFPDVVPFVDELARGAGRPSASSGKERSHEDYIQDSGICTSLNVDAVSRCHGSDLTKNDSCKGSAGLRRHALYASKLRGCGQAHNTESSRHRSCGGNHHGSDSNRSCRRFRSETGGAACRSPGSLGRPNRNGRADASCRLQLRRCQRCELLRLRGCFLQGSFSGKQSGVRRRRKASKVKSRALHCYSLVEECQGHGLPLFDNDTKFPFGGVI